MAYELYLKTSELKTLKGQQSADYFIVHNLRKAFTVPLLTLADLLEDGAVNLKEAIEFVRAYAHIGEALVREFAVIEGGEDFKEVSLRKLLEEAVKRVKAVLSINDRVNEENLKIKPPERHFPRLEKDFRLKLLKNAFLNALFVILDNAYKYGATEVEVNVREENGYVKISFKDNGAGIEEELLSEIRKRLGEIEEEGEEEIKLNLSKKIRGDLSGGMGIGLQLVQRTLLRHKDGNKRGFLEVDSEGKGKGTVVTINIPLKEVENESNSSQFELQKEKQT